jgi:arylsulfatase A-like enzyme
MGGHPFDNGALHIRDEMLASFPRTPEETRRHIAEYYAMISHLDYQLGRVIRKLEDSGEIENTIVVFAGDNGLALGQHGLFGKQSCYEHSVRVPLIFAGPGVPAGTKSSSYAYLLDIFPTLCELSGMDVPESVEGSSLTPAFESPDSSLRDVLYFAYTDTQRAVKNERYKLVEYVVGGAHTQTQLFDLRSDPFEQTNIASDSQELVEEMRRELFRLRDGWDDRSSPWGKTFWSGYDRT